MWRSHLCTCPANALTYSHIFGVYRPITLNVHSALSWWSNERQKGQILSKKSLHLYL